MIRLFNISESQKWDEIVQSFFEYDIYYLSGYVKAFYIHGDGIPQLMYYQDKRMRAIYVFMKRKLSENMYDAITPYGYGGVLFEGETSQVNLQQFWDDYIQLMNDEHIIDNFVRYHPVIKNAELMRNLSTVIDLGNTIAIDLSSIDVVWNNMTSKNRNMIRKAEKNGVEIFHSKELSLFQEFMAIYNATMDHDKADNYYYFNEKFYQSIHGDLYDNYEMFYAVYKGKIIAMSIVLFANKQMHYHLSGSIYEYRTLAPTNLLLYKAAIWGVERGFSTFHLGGGVGSGEDSLYKFKASFNRNSTCQFSIGKEIFNREAYEDMVAERALSDADFNTDSSFFPLYRTL